MDWVYTITALRSKRKAGQDPAESNCEICTIVTIRYVEKVSEGVRAQ